MDHYAGGLQEWLADAPGTAGTFGIPGTRRIPGGSAPRGAFGAFIDALADRSVGSLLRVWLAIVVGCGLVDWLLAVVGRPALSSADGPVAADARGLVSALYFSAVTATSIGYGDMVPLGLARALAVGEGMAGLILFGCVVSKFVSRRQDELIAEIHHIAFEDRLGRVRTNLHLVRTEVQATARLCAGRDIAPPEAVARVESAAMVFVGELHAVHDVLYRPRAAVDESMLEAILASLASALREFNELISCVSLTAAVRPEPLRASMDTMTRLANDICGECVPHEFAPALKTWMDEIQRLAGGLSQI